MSGALVSQTLREGVLTLELGNAPAHPLSLGMIDALHRALDDIAENQDARVVILHGAGKIYCAGHDLKEISRHRGDPDQGLGYLTELFNACSDMMQAIVSLPQPTIAMVDGIATAGGLQLVASCDLAFASPVATFAMPGISNGGFCTTPAVAVGRSIARKHVMEMALSGQAFDADWARSVGLINKVVPADELASFTHEFAVGIARGHAPALAAGKQTLYQQLQMPLTEAYKVATITMINHFMDPKRIEIEVERWGGNGQN